jgi:hypothetical protein
MTAAAMRASSYEQLMQEALHEFKAWERRMVVARRKKGEGQCVPRELGAKASDDGECLHPDCPRPAVVRGMCRRHYLRWYLKHQKEKGRGATPKGLDSGS